MEKSLMADITAYTVGKNPAAVALLHKVRDKVLALGPIDERVHPSEVAWADKRVFTSAFIVSNRLELAIDLLRIVEHKQLREAFATTKKVTTHRFWFDDAAQLDKAIFEWIAEAYETVGPGTR